MGLNSWSSAIYCLCKKHKCSSAINTDLPLNGVQGDSERPGDILLFFGFMR